VACEQAVEAIGNVIADLDMALVFAAAGQLDPVDKGENFNTYRQTILDGSRDLTNDAKGLVAGATGTQDQLVIAAQSSVRSIEEIARAMKAAATAMTSADRNGQDQLLNAARTVAVKLQDHVDASMKGASWGAKAIRSCRDHGGHNADAVHFGGSSHEQERQRPECAARDRQGNGRGHLGPAQGGQGCGRRGDARRPRHRLGDRGHHCRHCPDGFARAGPRCAMGGGNARRVEVGCHTSAG
jgi:hypothetical protein